MKFKNKNGASNMILVLIIAIGIVLVISGIGLMLMSSGKLELNMFKSKKDNVKAVTQMVSTTVDTVPIPTGFYYVGGSKASGLVISDNPDDREKGDSYDINRTLVGNQYVWIPVEDMAAFKRATTKDNFNSKNVSRSIVDNNDFLVGVNLWEVVLDELGKPTSANTEATLKEAQAMYNSVEKYKGFYIARFEAGLEFPRVKIVNEETQEETMPYITGQNIRSKQGMYPYNNISWSNNNLHDEEKGGAVELSRSIYPANSNQYAVVSTLVYGVQWDSIAKFISSSMDENHEVRGNMLGSRFSFFGKYMENEAEQRYITDNISTEKTTEQVWLFTTGATSYAKTKNIYDLAGNVNEFTMEGVTFVLDEYIGEGRVTRGGSFKDAMEDTMFSTRAAKRPTYSSIDTGFRVALYIK